MCAKFAFNKIFSSLLLRLLRLLLLLLFDNLLLEQFFQRTVRFGEQQINHGLFDFKMSDENASEKLDQYVDWMVSKIYLFLDELEKRDLILVLEATKVRTKILNVGRLDLAFTLQILRVDFKCDWDIV